MTDRVFVDTNILVYSKDLGAGSKHEKANELVHKCWGNRSGVISIQVLNEYFVTVTRKLKPGLDPQVAWRDISLLRTWQLIQLDWMLLDRAHDIFSDHSVSCWDAQTVAAAQVADCKFLYTEDLNHGEKFGKLVVQNPFH
ncbi:PIN domain-containing protein [Opitutia bacterium ISCC 51]|nr:PIN domain-containing protein [Opitutae bacterium ISCC 51]QXD29932.1 PIN domain-containing protein [Opitutae bacterium ISCC 52]